MTTYPYKAISSGTLTRPYVNANYMFVPQGKTVHLNQPVKSEWLLPLNEAAKVKELPPTPYMRSQGMEFEASHVPPVPVNDAYQSQIETMDKAAEGLLAEPTGDEDEAVETPAEDAGEGAEDSSQSSDEDEGTGNQSVI